MFNLDWNGANKTKTNEDYKFFIDFGADVEVNFEDSRHRLRQLTNNHMSYNGNCVNITLKYFPSKDNEMKSNL